MKTLRTPREILTQDLTPEVAQKAISNVERYPFGVDLLNDADEQYQTAHETLLTTFAWHYSNEGELYWKEIYEELQRKGL